VPAWLTDILLGKRKDRVPASLRRFTVADPTISRDLVVDGDAWLITTTQSRVVPLFEVENPGGGQCLLTYRAAVKVEGLDGRAYLEMWCRLPGRGEFFSRGFRQQISGTTGWASVETPFRLKAGQTPDLIKLNLVVEGAGKTWIKDVELLKTSR
jgi:hypothetical protein